MASNEHKNLSEGNLHNPKGFSTATNDTLCSKDDVAGLTWLAKSEVKVKKATFSGYCSVIANYKYPVSQSDAQSPYEISLDYGSATISNATTVSQNLFYRIGHFVADQACTFQQAYLEISAPDVAITITVALVKYTPSDAVATSYPVSIFEQPAITLGNDNLVSSYTIDMTDPAIVLNLAIAKGDHIFLMAKGSDIGTGNAYISVGAEFGYTN